VTLDYTQQGLPSTVAAFCGEDTFAGSLRRVLAARGLTIRVTAHPALTPADGELNRRELAALAARSVRGGRPAAAEPVRRASTAAALIPSVGAIPSEPAASAPAPAPSTSRLPDTPLWDTPAHV